MANELLAISKVLPSAAAWATAWAPMLPLAPGRFSTTTGWPRRCCSCSPRRRASRSVPPPGGNVTTMVMGRSRRVPALPGAASHSPDAPASSAQAASVQSLRPRKENAMTESSGVEADVENPGAVRDPAHGDLVHAGLGHGARRLGRDAAPGGGRHAPRLDGRHPPISEAGLCPEQTPARLHSPVPLLLLDQKPPFYHLQPAPAP